MFWCSESVKNSPEKKFRKISVNSFVLQNKHVHVPYCHDANDLMTGRVVGDASLLERKDIFVFKALYFVI